MRCYFSVSKFGRKATRLIYTENGELTDQILELTEIKRETQNMMEKHGGLPQPTSSKWIKEGDSTNEDKILETPTGKTFRVIMIKGIRANLE